ncbi:histone-fold-containing protein [Apiospora phragmitis]|uniref:Histone-fold-containing protein n=1 Tax=Apiospora phragmitis TaxID=2905665 RepID=A0ABR1TTM0_9PEZI
MQADEEVGKVAQQTPIAVGKALELFMVQIVTKSADVAKERNSKRISAQMLKQAIDSNNEWDFLREIVAKVSEKGGHVESRQGQGRERRAKRRSSHSPRSGEAAGRRRRNRR